MSADVFTAAKSLWAALNLFLVSRGFGLLAILPRRLDRSFGFQAGMGRAA